MQFIFAETLVRFIGSAFVNIEPDYYQLEYLSDIFREKRDTFWVIEKKKRSADDMEININIAELVISQNSSRILCLLVTAAIALLKCTGPAQEFEVFEGAS